MKNPNIISQKKVHRKIWYLRSMGKPNFEGGATAKTWQTFWRVFFQLRLADKDKTKNYLHLY